MRPTRITTVRSFREALTALTALSFFIICCFSLFLYLPPSWTFMSSTTPSQHKWTQTSSHPIQHLMREAGLQFSTLSANQPSSVSSAAQAYRHARDRHPPPGFEQWFDFAQERGAYVMEDMFDQIYHDLSPFWSVPAATMRQFSSTFQHQISVRNGTASLDTSYAGGVEKERMEIWLELVQSIATHLPDLDMAMSTLDSSRVFARWEDVHVAVNLPHYASSTKKLSRHYINDTQAESLESLVAAEWTPADEELLWDIAQVGCPPDSPARNNSGASDPSSPHDAPNGLPYSSFQGYVQNVTSAKDLCHRLTPYEIHGVFQESIYLSATHRLIPIFGGSKLPLSNDILIPSAAHVAASLESDTPLNAIQKLKPFEDKSSALVWHGVRRDRKVNSKHGHQERFVATLDAATVREMEMRPEMMYNGLNLAYTAYEQYRDMATDRADIATWLGHVASVALTDPPCVASECEHGHRIYKTTHHATMEQQLKYKLLADIDGESPSSRFHDILRSTSAPVKATIFNAWHDSRLIPWLHYIPMDPSFIDIYGILDYFLGNGKAFRAEDGKMAVYGAHEEAAHKIAVQGKDWADKVLRAEDMQVYTLRLLLEYARLCDDNRTRSGYVVDPPA